LQGWHLGVRDPRLPTQSRLGRSGAETSTIRLVTLVQGDRNVARLSRNYRLVRRVSGPSGSSPRAGAQVGVRSLVEVAYQHILVAYDGTSEGDAAVLAASKLASRDGARLTVVTVVALERPIRRVTRLPMLTSVWNDVLLDRARADLERADGLLDMPAERAVLFGSQTKALAAGAEEFGCDAIMLPAHRSRRLAELLHLDRSRRLRRGAAVPVLHPR
jgi:nucleotide-binding universal stress UspA family protein